jgi:hypothetical protein
MVFALSGLFSHKLACELIVTILFSDNIKVGVHYSQGSLGAQKGEMSTLSALVGLRVGHCNPLMFWL